MTVPDWGVVLFPTSSAAMQAEAILARAHLAVRLIPTPRELSSDCGLSLRFDWCQADQVAARLRQARVDTAGLHHLPAPH